MEVPAPSRGAPPRRPEDLDKLTRKISQFAEAHHGGTVEDLRKYLQKQDVEEAASKSEAERYFRKSWEQQKQQILAARTADMDEEIAAEEKEEFARLDGQVKTIAQQAAAQREDELQAQRASWKQAQASVLRTFGNAWRDIHPDAGEVSEAEFQRSVGEVVRRVEETLAAHHREQLARWEAAQNRMLQRLHACDEELIRLEEDARVAVHREAEAFLAEFDERKRAKQEACEQQLNAREKELHLALLSLEHQREGYDEEARAKYEKLLEEHRASRQEDARLRIRRVLAQLSKAAEAENQRAEAVGVAVELIEEKAPGRYNEVLKELRATWARMASSRRADAEQAAAKAVESEQRAILDDIESTEKDAMAWPKATDGVGPMREHQAHIRAEMQAHLEHVQAKLAAHKQQVELEIAQLLRERDEALPRESTGLQPCADVAESGLASLGPGAGRAGPESQALALLASLVRHTERARTHWHDAYWMWKTDQQPPESPGVGPMLRDALVALQELWKLLDVPQEERDTFGDDLLEQVRTVSGPTAEALDKELAMLADRVPILEVLQKREAAKALGDAATNPQVSARIASFEQYLAVAVKDYEEKHGTRFRYRGRLVIGDLLGSDLRTMLPTFAPLRNPPTF